MGYNLDRRIFHLKSRPLVFKLVFSYFVNNWIEWNELRHWDWMQVRIVIFLQTLVWNLGAQWLGGCETKPKSDSKVIFLVSNFLLYFQISDFPQIQPSNLHIFLSKQKPPLIYDYGPNSQFWNQISISIKTPNLEIYFIIFFSICRFSFWLISYCWIRLIIEGCFYQSCMIFIPAATDFYIKFHSQQTDFIFSHKSDFLSKYFHTILNLLLLWNRLYQICTFMWSKILQIMHIYSRFLNFIIRQFL